MQPSSVIRLSSLYYLSYDSSNSIAAAIYPSSNASILRCLFCFFLYNKQFAYIQVFKSRPIRYYEQLASMRPYFAIFYFRRIIQKVKEHNFFNLLASIREIIEFRFRKEYPRSITFYLCAIVTIVPILSTAWKIQLCCPCDLV